MSGKLKGYRVESVVSELSKSKDDQQVHDAGSRFELFKALRSLASELLLFEMGHRAEANEAHMEQDQLGRLVWDSVL